MSTEPQLMSELLATLDGGTIDRALAMDIAALVEEVQAKTKPASITLKIVFEPMGLNGHAVQVLASHTITPPKPARAGSVLFVGDHGSLHRTDPYQGVLGEVPANPETGEKIQ